jgi:hypothetical protein
MFIAQSLDEAVDRIAAAGVRDSARRAQCRNALCRKNAHCNDHSREVTRSHVTDRRDSLNRHCILHLGTTLINILVSCGNKKCRKYLSLTSELTPSSLY